MSDLVGRLIRCISSTKLTCMLYASLRIALFDTVLGVIGNTYFFAVVGVPCLLYGFMAVGVFGLDCVGVTGLLFSDRKNYGLDRLF